MITHFRQAIEETLPWLSSFGADPAGVSVNGAPY